MMGGIRPERNCDFHADSRSMSLVASNSFTVASSRPNAFTTAWPENVSSTCPLILPSSVCCAKKYFWDRLTTKAISASDTGTMTSVISVMTQLMLNIMMTTPTTVVTEVSSCVMPWLKLCPSVSTSFVMRESTSPVDTLSK